MLRPDKQVNIFSAAAHSISTTENILWSIIQMDILTIHPGASLFVTYTLLNPLQSNSPAIKPNFMKLIMFSGQNSRYTFQCLASKMTELNQHLSDTQSTKSEHYELHKGRIYCRALVWDCIGFRFVSLTNCQQIPALNQ